MTLSTPLNYMKIDRKKRCACNVDQLAKSRKSAPLHFNVAENMSGYLCVICCVELFGFLDSFYEFGPELYFPLPFPSEELLLPDRPHTFP